MGAPVVWFEVAGRDFDTLSKFYTELFHWKVNADNPIGYGMVETGGEGGVPGGIFAGVDSLDSPAFRDMHVDDICNPVDPATLGDRLTAAGFTVIRAEANPYVLEFQARVRE